MKQLIVLIATIILGAGISGIILGFQDSADGLDEAAVKVLDTIEDKASAAAIDLAK